MESGDYSFMKVISQCRYRKDLPRWHRIDLSHRLVSNHGKRHFTIRTAFWEACARRMTSVRKLGFPKRSKNIFKSEME